MPLVQPSYALKLTNQSSAPAKSTSQSSLFSPIAPSNSSALVKPPSSSGVSDANYSDWSPWSRCSTTCGHQAVTHRKRTCKLIGGKTCQGNNTETKQCQFFRCPGIATENKQSLSVSWIGLAGNLETEEDRLYLFLYLSKHLRAVCCKDQLRSCNIEKTDFPKLCQNKGLGELVLKI